MILFGDTICWSKFNLEVKMFIRRLDLNLPKQQSAFLWGARQTGKSSFLKSHFKQAIYHDLLDTHEFMRFTRSPYLLREELLTLKTPKLVIIDEIQKVPELLNEVHGLIESHHIQFILCGSSARKLKTPSTNLLGGRAWVYHFYPLIYPEIPDFDLLRALKHGLLPRHYLAPEEEMDNHFQAYVDTYLTDEIRNEGLVRNLVGFARFLDVAGLCNGEMININNIARDCGVDRTTVQGYYQILIDTMLGYFIYPYAKKVKRDLITAMPKFYLFDVGVANYLARQKLMDLRGAAAGKAFEHYIFMELQAYMHLERKRLTISYWRTKTGLEVDFVLGEAQFAVEVKITEQVHQADLKGLIAFCEEHPHTKAVVVSLDKKPRLLKVHDQLSIAILPWRDFLTQLWAGQFF